MQLGGLGERCKLPQRVWGGAPAANDFGDFWTIMKMFGLILFNDALTRDVRAYFFDGIHMQLPVIHF